jgi:hypothetical protein
VRCSQLRDSPPSGTTWRQALGSAIVGWYPYFFVNPHRPGGYLLVAGDCLAVGVGIIALIALTTVAGNRRGDGYFTRL